MSGAPATTMQRAAVLAAALFCLAAAVFGVLEVHPSTDTWIGLALGREIATTHHVPTADTFSYVTAGRVFINQNWLTHWLTWRLYDGIGPGAVIWAAWIAGWTLFASIALAARWRGAPWGVALGAAGIAAIGCRDYLSARPATYGLALLALAWALVAALGTPSRTARRIAALALFPLFFAWGNAHGSFVFGYALVAAFLAERALARRQGRGTLAWDELGLAAGALAAAVLATLALGPFGLANFIHPGKIASSAAFRTVAEWLPLWDTRPVYPPTTRFFAVAVLLALACVVAAIPAASRGKQRPAASAPLTAWPLYEVAVAAGGLAMAAWARRFIPLALILGAPLAASFAGARLGRFSAAVRASGTIVATGLCAIAAVVTANAAWQQARTDLVTPYAGATLPSLLDRVTVMRSTALDALEYIRRNELACKLVTEWNWAGPAMLLAPQAKVLIDGRAQQVYDDADYALYTRLMLDDSLAPKERLALVDGDLGGGRRRPAADAVLLRAGGVGRGLMAALAASREFAPLLSGPDFTFFVRRGSAVAARIETLVASGREWRPATPIAQVGLGMVHVLATPPRFEPALAAWRAAAAQDVRIGAQTFPYVVSALLALGRADEARAYVDDATRRVAAATLDENARAALGQALAESRRRLGQAPRPELPATR